MEVPIDKRPSAAFRAASRETKLSGCPLFYLNFRNTDRRSVVIIEAEALTAARMKAALAGLDRELEFDSGLELDETNSRQIPKEMIGRLLDDRDLRRLQRSISPKKPGERA